MSQNNTSSNETHCSFAAPARPSDTPGSGDSGGGGTTSWMAFSSSAHSGTSAGHGQTTPRGRPQRLSAARSARCPSRLAIKDRSNVGSSTNITISNGASPSAGTAKHKSSNSVTRGENELRKQLLHVSNEMDKSEKARFALEERVSLFEDALHHRNEAMCEMEIYSNYKLDMYQQYVSTEVEYMRESLASAARIMSEQSEALAEAHLMDAGSTMRIMELGRRNELAEDGAQHIIQESEIARQRCHSELENAVRHIQEQHHDAEETAEQFRQQRERLQQECHDYVAEKQEMNRQ